MRVVAVIPACEGSDTLPNKNLRVICGKPLVYYPIRAALDAKRIDEVLVTTNSEEVALIASHMGARVKMRSPELCNANVSLERVVHDAVKDLRLDREDYVATIHSVSPNVKSFTLDAAINKCITENLDTIISVVRIQNFLWKKMNGKAVALYDSRPNRHKLEPFYAETGAFLISKSKFIREDSRLGEHVELFEVSPEEGVDIDNFGDIKQAESIIRHKQIAFYVNGNDVIGLGHINRVLQIADELAARPDIYYDYNCTNVLSFGGSNHKFIGVNGTEGFIDELKKKHYNLVINDILSTSEEYMLAVRSAASGAKILNFEDEGTGAHLADAVISALYEQGTDANVYTGKDYYVLPKLFLLYEPIKIKPKVEKVLVSFGGADPMNYTEMLLRIISKPKFSHVNFVIVVGQANKNWESISKYSGKQNVEILHDIKDMPKVISQCDVAVSSRGRTGFELAFMGVPSISIAQNEREERHDFMCKKNGFTYFPRFTDSEVIEQKLWEFIEMPYDRRMNIQLRMLSNNLRDGRSNILKLIDRITD